MKLYAPRYYKEFKCKADKCRHSCCIGWEIGVDEETLCKYGSLPKGEREELLSHIENGIIKLSSDRHCPFLDSSGLCKIISRHGEEYTSEICREHPRFYNYLPKRTEVGLGASCEEAARLIILEENFHYVNEIGEADEEAFEGYDILSERSWIYDILKAASLTYPEKLSLIKERYSLPERLFTDENLNSELKGLEYLNEENRAKLSAPFLPVFEADEKYCIRFFAYLVYRHMSPAGSYDELRARLCLCLLLLRLFESLCRGGTDPIRAAMIISEEIEYSEDNTDSLIFNFECEM